MFNNLIISMNLVRFVYFDNIQCGSLAAIRYAACAFKIVKHDACEVWRKVWNIA